MTNLKITPKSAPSADLVGIGKISSHVTALNVVQMMDRYGYSQETRVCLATENLLPAGLLSRLQAT